MRAMRGWLIAVALLAACKAQPSSPMGDDDGTPDGGTPGEDGGVLPPDAPPGEDPTAGIDWFTWPEQQPQLGQSAWGTQLIDIGRHLPSQYGDQYWSDDAITAAHETSHGIHAHLRNYEAPSPFGWNAFYVLGNQAAFVEEPNTRKSDVKQFIPAPLRGDRYDLYIEGQTEWDDTPLYVFDEWNAYINGAEVAVHQVEAGLYKDGWTDAVMGPLEFVVYAIATAQAAQAKDPTYFETNLQFRRFTAWNIKRAMALFEVGRTMSEFEWDRQDAYATEMRTGAAGEAMRAFARETWGAAWTQAVLGF
jgi:hypothetical protein